VGQAGDSVTHYRIIRLAHEYQDSRFWPEFTGKPENADDSIAPARLSLGRYFAFYNTERRQQSLDRRTPDSVYYESAARLAA
jgi:hypothetical protein